MTNFRQRLLIERLTAERDAARLVLATAREDPDWDPGGMVMLYDVEVDRTDKAEAQRDDLAAQLERVNDALRDAGIGYPLGAAGVRDLAAMASGRLEELRTAEAQLKMTRGQAADLIVTTAQFWRPETVADRLLDPECPRGYFEDAVRSAVRRAQGNADTIVRLNAARDLLLRDKP